MRSNKIILTISICLNAFYLSAQKESNNYFEIVRQSDEYYNKVGKNNPGYKHYKRWQWYMSTRTALNGDLVNIAAYKQQALVRTNWMFTNRTEANTGSWSFLGPNNISSTDNGIGRVNRIAFDPTNANILFVATAGGGLWKTTDGGGSWFSLTNGLPNLNTSGIIVDYSNPNTLYLLTGDGDAIFGGAWAQFGYVKYTTGVLKSSDGGNNWYQTGLILNETEQVRGFKIVQDPANPNTLLVATDDGIFRTTNGGSSWSQVSTALVYDIEFRPNNPNTLFASGNNNLYRSLNGGANWTSVASISGTAERTAIAVCPSNDTRVYLLAGPSTAPGSFRGFFRFNNTDSSITTVTTTPNILGRSTSGNDDDHQARYDLCLAVKPDNANYVYTGGIYLWRTTNGGSSFSWVDNSTSFPASKYHADIHDLAYNPVDGKLYMCCDGGVYVSSDNGITFDAINTYLGVTQYYKISSSKTNTDLIIGGTQDNGTNKKTSSSSVFTRILGSDGMDCAFGSSSNSIHFASEQDGVISRSGNSGSTFIEFANPNLVNTAIGYAAGTLEGQWCTPIALHPSNDNIIFIGYNILIKGTRDAALGFYTFEGRSGTISAQTFVKTGVSNADRIYIADNNQYFTNSSSAYNIVSRSDDGGDNWTTIRSQGRNTWPPVTDLAVNPGNSLEIWLTYGGFTAGGKVFYSSDGGANWTNVTGTLPNVPINCIIYGDDANNSNDPVYIGTDIGVFYKDNTLGDWIPFSNGLPSVEVTDLELNLADNLMRAGTYGRGMWETSLYSNCVANLTLSTANQSIPASYYHQVSNNISSTAITLGTGAEVFYKSGVEVELKDGFIASALDTTSTFRAFIGPCGGGVPISRSTIFPPEVKTGRLVGRLKE